MVMVNVNYLIYSQSTLYSLFSIKYVFSIYNFKIEHDLQ